MTDKSKKTEKSLSPSQHKLLNNAVVIWEKSATSKEAAFITKQLVQCTLPHSDPKADVWSRKNGHLILGIQAGFNHKTGQSYGLPFGGIPRVIMFWLTTEAIRTKSRRIQLGSSLSEFMRKIGLEPTGGRTGTINRLKNQIDRLFKARISFSQTFEGEKGSRWVDMQIASAGEFWWDTKKPEQNGSFENWIELGEQFYNAIISTPVPVDIRALRALKQSPLALDLYSWLTYEAYKANKSGKARFETWEQLHNHLGGDYAHIQHFRAKAKAALKKIIVVYPGLQLGTRPGGIEVLPNSLTALEPRTILEGEIISPKNKPLPIINQENFLKTTTIEKFKFKWPSLDPHVCQIDFENWLKSKIQPKNYDAAFLGFAEKWVVGKL